MNLAPAETELCYIRYTKRKEIELCYATLLASCSLLTEAKHTGALRFLSSLEKRSQRNVVEASSDLAILAALGDLTIYVFVLLVSSTPSF